MGARSNIALVYTDKDAPKHEIIYLYSHWGGEGIAETLQKALRRKQRWDDAPYLARIIANELFAPAFGDETGHGLSPYLCDNEYPILYVFLENQTVRVTPDDMHEPLDLSFKEYCDLEDPASLLR